MRRIMGNRKTLTSTRQEHRTVAGAMLLVLILSLVCAQWLSHYRGTISRERFVPELDGKEQFVELVTHHIDTLKIQLPPRWELQPQQNTDTFPGILHDAMFTPSNSPGTHLHVFELNAGQTQDPQSVIYAGIRHAISASDLSTLTIAHQWASRRANRMQRRMLAVSRSGGYPVFHHLMIWTHDGRSYWVFYTSQTSSERSVNTASLARFDKVASSLAMLAQDTRFTLATAADCAGRQFGFSAKLSDVYATCDAQSPSSLLLYPEVVDGFCVIRVARAASLDTPTVQQTLSWQFEATMRRKPVADELVMNQSLADTDWLTLHYPADKDMGIGPEPMSRDVHVFEPRDGIALTFEVTGTPEAVKQVSTLIPQLAQPLTQAMPSYEPDARKAGRRVVDHAVEHLDHTIGMEKNVYSITIADQLMGYQLEAITRPDQLHAQGTVHIVFPGINGGQAFIDHHWKIDFAKLSFVSATEDHTSDGTIKKRSLAMSGGQIVCESDTLNYSIVDAEDIPWPVSEDYWPVEWMTQKGLLEKWLLIRTVYSASPPMWYWVTLQQTDKGYRVLRRPIYSVDTNVYELDDKGNFIALTGYDFEAAAHSTLSLSVHRVDIETVYNQWPTRKSDIAKWIKDHETSDH